MATALTDSRIEAALRDPRRAGRLELIDGAEAGLRLRISGGAAQWSVLTRGFAAERVRMPLGGWPKVDVDQARRIAAALKGALAGLAAAQEDELSIGNVLGHYQTRRLAQLRKGAVMGRALETALGPLKHRLIGEVTRREIGYVIDDMADRAPVHANRVLAYAKAFFNWAVGRGYIEQSPAAAITKPTREKARERTPSLPEVAEIWRGAERLGYPFGPIVQLLTLTAARREEVGAMRVAELDLEGGDLGALWTVPAERSKNGRAIRSALSPLASSVLAKALEARDVDGPYVFSTTGRSPVSGWSRAKTRLDSILNRSRAERGEDPLDPWRFHDLRRSFATHACDLLHIDPVTVDRCLNHVGASTTSTVSRIYARSELFDQRREALVGWAALVERAVSKGQSGKLMSPRNPSGSNPE